MLDLLRGRTDTAPELMAVAAEASEDASLPDAWMVLYSMRGYTAVQTGDVDTCADIAAGMESFALDEGSTPVCAESAYMWLAAERPDEAQEVLHHLHGPVLDELPRTSTGCSLSRSRSTPALASAIATSSRRRPDSSSPTPAERCSTAAPSGSTV